MPVLAATAVRGEAPASDYEKAVQAYVDAAGNEVKALKAQADSSFKNATEARKAASQEFYAAYEKYAAAYERLKKASPKDFDPAKSNYEKHRQLAVDALAAAEKS